MKTMTSVLAALAVSAIATSALAASMPTVNWANKTFAQSSDEGGSSGTTDEGQKPTEGEGGGDSGSSE